MKPLREQTIIICGIVRDAEKGLRRNIPVINAICQQLKDFRIIIYENDSRDRTKDMLRAWHQQDEQRICISLNDTDPAPVTPQNAAVSCNPFFSKKRIEKMARLRNHYMEYIDSRQWTADLLMVVDMDVAQLRLDGILNTLQAPVEWDAVAANGYSTAHTPPFRRRYHDSYALTLYGDNTPQTELKIKSLAARLGKLKPGAAWLRVDSAFCGLAIYNFKAVKGLRYAAIPNNDPRVEVRCEHVSIYTQMKQRGYTRFFINPAMELKYQNLIPKNVWQSIVVNLPFYLKYIWKRIISGKKCDL